MGRYADSYRAKEAAAKLEAFNKTFAGQQRIINECRRKETHTPAFDPHYNHTFCTTCEEQLD